MEISSSGSKQKSGKTDYQLLLIKGLNKEIEAARKLDPEKLAAEIRTTGFSCQHCGKCCRRAFGDNRVMLIPPEIEKIREFTGLSKLEVAGPFVPETSQPDIHGTSQPDIHGTSQPDIHETSQPDIHETSQPNESEEENITEGFIGASEENEDSFSPEFLKLLQEYIDYNGNIHAFGWILRQKRNGDCIFLEKDTSRCRAYPVRPMLCRTYPFYIEELKLHTSECEGLGYHIFAEESRKLAENLLFRYVSELEDMLAMYEKFVNFRKGEKGLELAKKSLEEGICAYIVHDSTGSNKVMD